MGHYAPDALRAFPLAIDRFSNKITKRQPEQAFPVAEFATAGPRLTQTAQQAYG